MKRRTHVITAMVILALVLSVMPMSALADGSYSVETDYLVLKKGETATIVISAENAAGRVDWSGEGAVSSSGHDFLDNGVTTIEISADEVGTGYVHVVPTDIVTYDDEVLDYGYTITIDVVDDSGANPPADNTDNEIVADPAGQVAAEAPAEPAEPAEQAEQPAQEAPAQEAPAQEAPAQDDQQEAAAEQEAGDEAQEQLEAQAAAAETPAPAGDVLTDGNNDYQDLSEEERLYTSVEGQELYIIRYPLWIDEAGDTVWNDEVYNLNRLNGFDLVTVNYKNMDVDSFQYKDLMRVFVLKNLETDASEYYVLDDTGAGFKPLPYVTANGKQYIVVDFPEDFVVPEGYQMVELSLGSNTVHALKQIPAAAAEQSQAPAAPAEEQGAEQVGDTGSIVIDPHTMVMLKGYETRVSPGLDSDDPAGDIFYIYCLVDGKTQLYSYDSGEGTLQRASIVVYDEIPTEPETVIVYETAPEPQTETQSAGSLLQGFKWDNMQTPVKILLIALGVAILVIIILIILFAVMSSKNRKRNRRNRRSSGRRIPPRSTNRPSSALDDDEESFFSYVKTDKEDEFNINDLL